MAACQALDGQPGAPQRRRGPSRPRRRTSEQLGTGAGTRRRTRARAPAYTRGAARRTRAWATRRGRPWCGPGAVAPGQDGPDVGFERGKARIEEFSLRDHHDVQSGGDRIRPEHFPETSLGEVPSDGVAELPGHRHARAGSPAGPLARGTNTLTNRPWSFRPCSKAAVNSRRLWSRRSGPKRRTLAPASRAAGAVVTRLGATTPRRPSGACGPWRDGA